MPNVHIKLKPSKQFFILLLMVLIGAVFIIFNLPILNWLKILLIVVSLLYGLKIFWKNIFLRHKNSILGLSHDADGWKIHLREGIFPAELKGGTVSSWVSVFLFTHSKKSFECVIWNDSLKKDEYRRLKVLAAWF
jgi:hypothetical protein